MNNNIINKYYYFNFKSNKLYLIFNILNLNLNLSNKYNIYLNIFKFKKDNIINFYINIQFKGD